MPMIQSLSHVIVSEYDDYVNTAKKHQSPIDDFVVMSQCFEELPELISDPLAVDVIARYHSDFDGKLSIDPATVKKIICAFVLSMEKK